MIQVNLFVGSRYPIDRKKIRCRAKDFLHSHDIEHAQIDISIVGKRKIRELNESKLKHSGTTDVLSFPQHEKKQLDDFPLPSSIPPHLGDVVISFPEAVGTARRYGKLVDDQICFYLEHGIMHLLGYHHE
ncbi:MAG: rRNA maturation RNase YbeY [Candidatus Pacebacteria bacterium]|nr:rRNA maturation RNase YbeY [Candidatus Paceibacterota bacterium]PIR60793.1 MAG: rRNA maturation RNase YbeY [Candidatus Pacebacteria bacterium CG10_big_fil_rev_8_21_14_0_10_44_54]